MFKFFKQLFCNHEYHKVKENTIAGTNEKVMVVKCEKCGAEDTIFLD
jgi:ribosomal protein S27E